jgi:hypothetical protein
MNNCHFESKYVTFRGNAEIHNYPDHSILNVVKPLEQKTRLFLNKTASEILEMCNGANTIELIKSKFQKMYNAPLDKVSKTIDKVIEKGCNDKYLLVSDDVHYNPLKIYGSKKCYLPQKISIELTSKCNQKCYHCYGDFSPIKNVTLI